MKKENGQALVEYILIVAVVSVIAIAIVGIFGGHIKDTITNVSCSLTNGKYIEGNNPGEAKCNK